MNKYIIAPLLLCCLALTAGADTVQLREDHPERYVVVKGDTLWDISARFLNDPWLWPKVWNMNRDEIRNPHLIYPGDVVVLDLSGGEPRLRLLSETIKLQPGVRVEPLEKAPIPTIAPSVIAPFISQPLVVENEDLEGAPKIVAAQDGRLLLGPNMNIYVDKIEDDAGGTWQIYSPGEALTDPVSKEKLGIEAKYLGDARVLRNGTPATVQITKIKQDVAKGDRLMKSPDIPLNTFIPHAPATDVNGLIISTYEDSAEVGRNSVVVINRGSNDGIEDGHVLAIYRNGGTLPPEKGTPSPKKEGYVDLERNDDGSLKRDDQGRIVVRTGTRRVDGKADSEGTLELPDERIGLLMVFRTFDRVSYALIMESERPVHAEDIVATP